MKVIGSLIHIATSLLLVGAAGVSPALAQQYVISTYAGGAPAPTPVPAVNASIGSPQSVATDATGNVYFLSSNCVFKLDRNGILTRVVGNSRPGYAGDGGPALDAQFMMPGGLAVDTQGNLYIADTGNSRIRKVSQGRIFTVAGNGIFGSGGDGGPATAAELRIPVSVAVDSANSLYIADPWIRQLRKVSAGGIITAVLETTPGQSVFGPAGVAVDRDDNLYISDNANLRVLKVTPAGAVTTVAGGGADGLGDGGPATSAQLSGAGALAVDRAGNLYIADMNFDSESHDSNYRVRKVSPDGIITTVAGDGVRGYSGDGGPAISAHLNPAGLTVDGAGNLYIADAGSNRIRIVSADGIIITMAGDGSFRYSGDGAPAVSAQLENPSGLAVDSSHNLYIADAGNHRVRKVSPDGIITTVAGNGTAGFSGDGGAAPHAQLDSPSAVAVDGAGNLYISDSNNQRIRMVSLDGTIATVAGNGTPGFSGDGGPAIDAQINYPSGLAIDNSRNLYIADTRNARVRRVSTAGIISTIEGNGNYGQSGDGAPAASVPLDGLWGGLAVDSAGNLYIAAGRQVRMVSAAGTITTIAGNDSVYFPGFSGDGGPATSATLSEPKGLAVDTSGNVFIADTFNSRVRMVSRTGVITTVAGSDTKIRGYYGWYTFAMNHDYSGDGGPGLDAQLAPWSLAVDGTGNIYVADTGNGAVRLLQPFYLKSALLHAHGR